MRYSTGLSLLVLVSLCFAFQATASAQFVPRTTNVARATRDYVLNRPTVSPYLNLIRNDNGLNPNYQTLVRPAMEQRQRQAQASRQIRQLQSQVTNMQGEMALSRARNGTFSTGHPTRFMYYLHFYPALNR